MNDRSNMYKYSAKIYNFSTVFRVKDAYSRIRKSYYFLLHFQKMHHWRKCTLSNFLYSAFQEKNKRCIPSMMKDVISLMLRIQCDLLLGPIFYTMVVIIIKIITHFLHESNRSPPFVFISYT